MVVGAVQTVGPLSKWTRFIPLLSLGSSDITACSLPSGIRVGREPASNGRDE